MKKIEKLIRKIKFWYRNGYSLHKKIYPPHYVDIGRRETF
jgi:hypothetical protein